MSFVRVSCAECAKNLIMQSLVFMTIILAVVLEVSGERISNRIVGGSDAPDGKYPYQVSIRRRDLHYCGGSIIGKRWILSAAHCFIRFQPSRYRVVVGTNSRFDGGRIYKVNWGASHPNYPFADDASDIAIIRTTEEIIFNERVQPIRLPESDFTKEGDLVLLTGWGRTAGGSQPVRLQHVNLTIDTKEHCELFWKGEITHQICTLTNDKKGSCNGDSGGPLVADGVLVGVVSKGRPCATGASDVFTRVWIFLDWINEKIAKNS